MDQLDLQQLELLLYAFAGLIVLTLIGLAIYVIVSVRRRDREAAKALSEIEDLVIRPSFLVVGQVLALVRDEPGESLQVEVDGTKYRSLAEVDDPQVRRQIVDAALEFIQFTGVLGGEQLPLAPLNQTESWREDMREKSQTELARALHGPADPAPPPAPEEVEERFLDLLTEMGQTGGQPSRPTLVGSIQQRLQPKPRKSDGPRSFVDDIEDIVQRRLPMIPALAGRDLHVRPASGGKVLFMFEGQEYHTVAEIPNLTARQVIQEAIQEWDETA